jgi:glutathione synthase/RimK-type ligase-like ATP-grasp enzyme
MKTDLVPIAVYHEHPDWFRPLFAEMDRRGLPYVRLDPRAHSYDPGAHDAPYSLLFNRMSPSAYLRGGVQGIFFTLCFLAHLERLGVPVVNGRSAFTVETSKALQLTLLESLGLPYPRARVINHASKAAAAAEGLRFPVVVKANVGGSGAGIVRYDRLDDLARAAEEGRINLGVDHTALVQEFIPARDGCITRIETMGGKYLYGIRIHITGDTFNLCPGDICQRSDGVELKRTACPVDAPKTGLKVEALQPPDHVVDAVEAIVQTAGIDLGGIEYIIDDRDGRLMYYDINALSNFVADARNVVGFDPFARLVDYLEVRASLRAEAV